MMKYQDILNKATLFQKNKENIDPLVLLNWESVFEVEYTHDSTAIEGNTLTLMETKVVLDDGISVGGKMLREIYEVVNHRNAYRYVKQKIAERKALDETAVKDIHSMLMENIFAGGYYRNQNVKITGAQHIPPAPNEMYRQVKNFFADLPWRYKDDPITLAAWTHAEFVRIHPFVDGNGRTSRLIMNYQLMYNGLLPVSIPKLDRLEYFKRLEEYALTGNVEPFADYVATLEERKLDEVLAAVR